MKNIFKKIIIILVSILMLFSLFGQFMVSAEETDSIAPEINEPADDENQNPDKEVEEVEVIKDVFEVVSIDKSGTISVVETFENFDLALSKMNENRDGAIRYHKSDSPLKYIAATRGIVYSAPKTAATMSIWDINRSGTRTYISPGYDMTYYQTRSFDKEKNQGVAHVSVSGFEGTAYLSDLDIIPMIYVENSLFVNIKRNPNSFTPKISHHTVKQGVKRESVVFINHRNGRTSEHFIGPAKDTFMQLGIKYYSKDGVTMYTEPDFRPNSKAGVYYNYYQYLPLRTKSDVPASVLNQYIVNKKGLSRESVMLNTGQLFIKYANQYGMNPLLVFAMGIHESGWGTSNYAVNHNNLFGWDAVDSNPSNAKKYASLEVGIKEHMALQLRGYLDVNYENTCPITNITYKKDGRFHGGHLGNRGSGLNLKYASDPYWGIKIAQYAYLIDDLAGLVDYQKYSLALVNDGDEFLTKRSDVSITNQNQYGYQVSDIFYNHKSIYNYMHNLTLAVEDYDLNTYQSQTFASLDSNKNIINIYSSKRTPAIDYNWQNNIGFFKKSKVTIVSKAKPGSKPDNKPAAKPGFLDVGVNHEFYPFVKYLEDNKITFGFTEGERAGQFGVNDPLTRRHAAMFLVRALGFRDEDLVYSGAFADVKATDSGAGNIQKAFDLGLIGGYENDLGTRDYRPDATLKRSQFAKMVALAYNLQPDDSKDLTMTDLGTSTEVTYIKAILDHGIVNGYKDNTYGPNKNVTRGHVSKFIYNAQNLSR